MSVCKKTVFKEYIYPKNSIAHLQFMLDTYITDSHEVDVDLGLEQVQCCKSLNIRSVPRSTEKIPM